MNNNIKPCCGTCYWMHNSRCYKWMWLPDKSWARWCWEAKKNEDGRDEELSHPDNSRGETEGKGKADADA